MKCKNCDEVINISNLFCSFCGGKVSNNRITGKGLFGDLISKSFGWDNRFFRTIKTIVVSPQIIYQGYFEGARSKYTNPFKFFGIAAAICLIVFNIYSTEYMELTKESMVASNQVYSNEKQLEEMTAAEIESLDKTDLRRLEFNERLGKQTLKFTKWTLTYYSLFSFLVLPFYALIALVVFRKPHNYGEHLVINAYIQGFALLIMVLSFLLSLITNLHYIFSLTIPVTAVFYLYSYKRLNNYSFGKIILKLLRFLLLFAIIGILFTIAGVVYAVLTGSFSNP